MIKARRYRVFLLVVILSAVTFFYLAKSTNWDVPDYIKPGNHPLQQDEPELKSPVLPTTISDPVPEPPPIPPAPPALSTSRFSPLVSPTTPVAAAGASLSEEAVILTQASSIQTPTESSSSSVRSTSQPTETHKPVYWVPQKERFPVQQESLIALPHGEPLSLPKIQHEFGPEGAEQKQDRLFKRAVVREAFEHAWKGYKLHAAPHDELKPLTESHGDPFNGWGATLVDALDTLWIMGMKEDFQEAVELVSKIDFTTSTRPDIPVFETTIRYVGGLIGAYDISGGQFPVLKDKAVQLADVLMGAFDTPNRLPSLYYRWHPSDASKLHRSDTNAVVAELGSLSLEFTRLAQITSNPKYYDAVARITNQLEKWQMETEMPGLWPLRVDASGCDRTKAIVHPNIDTHEAPVELDTEEFEPDAELAAYGSRFDESSSKREVRHPRNVEPTCVPKGLSAELDATTRVYGIGAMGDSLYEYMPKMHALLNGVNKQYRSMYEKSREAIKEQLLFRPMVKEVDRDVLFHAKHKFTTKRGTSSTTKKPIYEGTHLGCFAGGMFALGSALFGLPSDMSTAAKLTDGCVWAYESTPSGVMPEEFSLVPCESQTSCSWDNEIWYKALDPHEANRTQRADAYNEKQRKLQVTAQQGTVESSPTSSAIDASTSQASHEFNPNSKKRDIPLDASDNGFIPLKAGMLGISSLPSIPAMSHQKYAAARVIEERLPPGYTEITARDYRLRPEAIESVFIMYRMTGESKWQDKGWTMFRAVDRATRTITGYAQLKDVTSQLGELADKMESFWLAETLKYYYLLFSEPELVNLDEYVLNTEAHPFKLTTPHPNAAPNRDPQSS